MTVDRRHDRPANGHARGHPWSCARPRGEPLTRRGRQRPAQAPGARPGSGRAVRPPKPAAALARSASGRRRKAPAQTPLPELPIAPGAAQPPALAEVRLAALAAADPDLQPGDVFRDCAKCPDGGDCRTDAPGAPAAPSASQASTPGRARRRPAPHGREWLGRPASPAQSPEPRCRTRERRPAATAVRPRPTHRPPPSVRTVPRPDSCSPASTSPEARRGRRRRGARRGSPLVVELGKLDRDCASVHRQRAAGNERDGRIDRTTGIRDARTAGEPSGTGVEAPQVHPRRGERCDGCREPRRASGRANHPGNGLRRAEARSTESQRDIRLERPPAEEQKTIGAAPRRRQRERHHHQRAQMMFLYLDSSALVKRYIEEPHSEEVAHLMDETLAIGTSAISRVEVGAALARAARGNRLDAEEARERRAVTRDTRRAPHPQSSLRGTGRSRSASG